MPRTARITSTAVFALIALLATSVATAAAAGKTKASFSFAPLKPTVGATLALDSRGTTCAAKPCRYLWTAQAAGKKALKLSTKAKATLKLSASGTFAVTLKVTDKRRRSSTFKRSIVVAPAPPAFSPALPVVLAPTPPAPIAQARVPATPAITAPADGALLASSSVTLNGTADAGATVSVLDGAAELGTATADGSGAWSRAVTLSDGTHALTARAADAAGNLSALSAARTVRVDTTAPAAPVFTAPAPNVLLASSSVTLSGTAENGATVELFEGAVSRGTAVAAGGVWSTTLTLSDGTHAYTAKASDAAGNVSPASAARSVRVDTTAPPAPAITGPAQDTLLASSSVTLSGTAENGATVELFEGAVSRGTAVAAGGVWSTTLTVADGTHAYTAKASDAAGNVSAASAARSLRVDTTAPDAPAITGPAEAAVFNATAVTLTGTAEAGATVEIFDGTTSRGTVVAAGGSWSKSVANLEDGSHGFTARATDAAGHTSAASARRSVWIDTQAPGAPVIQTPAHDALLNTGTIALVGTMEQNSTVEIFEGATSLGVAIPTSATGWRIELAVTDGTHDYTARATDLAGNGTSSPVRRVRIDTHAPAAPTITAPALVNADAVTLSGEAEPGATVEIFEGAASRGTALAGDSGAWSKALSALADGDHVFTARATDVAGNTGSASAARLVRVDTTAPETSVQSGPSGDTKVAAPSFAFTSNEADASFRCRLDGPGAATGTFAACTSPKAFDALADGHYVLRVYSIDAAGNADASDATRSFTVDTVAPAAPAITAPDDEAVFGSSSLTVSGTAEPGATVELFEGVTSRGTAVATAAGAWSKTVTGVPDGRHLYSARATDVAGNTGDASASRSVRVDTLAPAAPVITEPAADDLLFASGEIVVKGTAEPFAGVRLSIDGAAPTTAAVADSGDWSLTVSLADGAHSLSARAVDVAGNVSAAPSVRTVRVDSTPPETVVEAAPPQTVSVDNVTFGFSGGAKYECRLDGPGDTVGDWAQCESPHHVKGLSNGDYRFTVRALDEAGNRDLTPEARTFGVLLEAPPAAEVFVAPEGDDGRLCTREAPCKSLERAYTRVLDDGVIEIDGGQYGDQELPEGTKTLTVRSAAGERAELRFLDNWAANSVVRDVTVQQLNVRGNKQVYDGVEVDGKFARRAGIEHWTGNDVVFKNGRVGNILNEKGAVIGEHRWTFDNVEFHDVRVDDPLVHNECVYATGAEGLTIRNSDFHDCATMDLFVTNYAGGPAFGNITLENNVFAHTTMEEPGSWHYYTIGVHNDVGELRNWVVRNNTFETGVSSGPTKGTGRWVGNLGDWNCVDGLSYRFNVGQACGELDSGVYPAASTKDRPAAFGWLDPARRNFRFGANSPALDAADPEDFPATDRDGAARPKGWGPDAGAYEVG